MAGEQTPPSILAQHVAAKRRMPLYGNAIAEVSAIALDLSAMMAGVVMVLDVISRNPTIANSQEGQAIQPIVAQLKARFQEHSTAMAELNRGR